MMSLHSLQDLMMEELRDLYDAEKQQLLRTLPKMAEASATPALTGAFRDHLQVTATQVERLEAIFERLGTKASGRKCRGMQGLWAESKETIAAGSVEAVRDAALIAAAQRVEHYEIAAYGCAVRHADLLGHDQIAALLHASLKEEQSADATLAGIADGEVNAAAMAAAGNGADRY